MSLRNSDKELILDCPGIHLGELYRWLRGGASGLHSCTLPCCVNPEYEPGCDKGLLAPWLWGKVFVDI